MAVRLSVEAAKAMISGLAGATVTGLDTGFAALFQGSQPTTPEEAATGSVLLGIFTVDDDGTTGLTWTVSDNAIVKPSGTVWATEGLVEGTAGWLRFYDSSDAAPASADATKVRVDMNCSRTSSTECILSTLDVTVGGTVSIDSATIDQPVS